MSKSSPIWHVHLTVAFPHTCRAGTSYVCYNRACISRRSYYAQLRVCCPHHAVLRSMHAASHLRAKLQDSSAARGVVTFALRLPAAPQLHCPRVGHARHPELHDSVLTLPQSALVGFADARRLQVSAGLVCVPVSVACVSEAGRAPAPPGGCVLSTLCFPRQLCCDTRCTSASCGLQLSPCQHGRTAMDEGGIYSIPR